VIGILLGTVPGLDLTVGESLFAAVVVLAAAYIRGLTGFALSAVLVAGMSFVIDPVEAVTLALAYEVAGSTIQGRSVWSDIKWRHLWVLIAAALIGNPVGVAILTTVDPDLLRAATFSVLAVVSLTLLLRHRATIAPTLPLFFAIGVAAGVVNGATALSGLVIVMAMSFMTISPVAMRSTLIAYFFISDIAVLGLLGARGDIPGTAVARLALGLPLLAAGIFVGSSTFDKTPPERFRRITLGLLIVISAVGLTRLAVG